MGWKFLCCVTPDRSKKDAPLAETALDFSRCNLSDIDTITENFDFPETIIEIDFSYNKLEELDPILLRCKNLRVLNLSDNQLISLPDQLATAFTKLSIINLAHNRFESIPTFFSYGNFVHLQTVDLSNNPIGKILDGTITELVSLRELRLNSCSLNFLPANIARLTSLESLELRENYLESLPLTIKLLTKLKLLDLGRNNLEELQPEIGYLFNIQELIVDENNLVDVSIVGDLINLRHLDISANNLAEFPEEITKCQMLETLYVDGNEFESLSDEIGNLKKLTKLNLNCIRLNNLTHSIGYCESLEELNLHENFLENLPSSIGLLRNLRILVAYDNRLKSLPDELASCISLTHLNVANNKLGTLPDNIGYLKNLKSLNVIGNYLLYLPLSLGMIQNLEGLYLSPYQEGMKKPNLSRVEYGEYGIVLTSPLLEQNYRPVNRSDNYKQVRSPCKIQFNVNNNSQSEEEDTRRNEIHEREWIRSPGEHNHNHIVRLPTPTQRERKRLEKFARTFNAERMDLSKNFEIKEAKVTPTSTTKAYTNTPRQRRSIDPEYIEIANSEFRPLSKEPPPYKIACQYSKMSQSEIENFQKANRNSISSNDQDIANSPLLSRNESVQ